MDFLIISSAGGRLASVRADSRGDNDIVMPLLSEQFLAVGNGPDVPIVIRATTNTRNQPPPIRTETQTAHLGALIRQRFDKRTGFTIP